LREPATASTYTLDDGKTWTQFKDGLPAAPVSWIEVQPTYPKGGKVVWEWHVWDHLVQDYSAAKSNYGNVAAHPELIDPNGGRQIPVFWNHMNSITYNADLDQVMVSVRGNRS
jgi:hypothetical protein